MSLAPFIERRAVARRLRRRGPRTAARVVLRRRVVRPWLADQRAGAA